MEVDQTAQQQMQADDGGMEFTDAQKAENEKAGIAQGEEEIKEYEKIVAAQMITTGSVSSKDFQTISVIGKGSYGKVLLVQKKDTKKQYALKILKKEEIIKRNQYEHTMAERRILESVNDPFIVKMDYAFQSENKLFFCLEYCPGGELFFYLSQIGRFKQDAARFYAANILLALKKLHSMNVLYRDLKPENVLVGGDGYIKLTDFGLSKEGVEGHQDAKSLCGTAEYLSPEILQRRGHGKATDWWSFGAIIYEMLVGLPPFFSKHRETLYQNIKYADPKLDYEFLQDDARDLCAKLLQKDPIQRLGSGENDAEEIMCHPWFECIDWQKIYNKELKPPYTPQLDRDDDVKHFPPEFTGLQPSPQDLESLKADGGTAFPNFSYQKSSGDEFQMSQM